MLGLGKITKKIFGTPNDRKVKATRPLVEKINALEPEFEKLTDAGLIEKTEELKSARLVAKALMTFCQKRSLIAAKVRVARLVCARLIRS